LPIPVSLRGAPGSLRRKVVVACRLLWQVSFPAMMVCATASLGVAPATAWSVKPYRVLLVVEHWDDPASVVIEHQKDYFQPVAALLKAWSVPFEILRLDQQHLDVSCLFERSGQVRYGVILWAADNSSYRGQDLAVLDQAVKDGSSLIVADSRFLDPVLEKLLGAKFKGIYTSTDPLRVRQPHFITRQLAAAGMGSVETAWDFTDRSWVETTGAQVLIDQADHPVVTVNQLGPEISATWLGVQQLGSLRDSAYWRGLLFRSLIWSLGYLIQPNLDYSHSVEIEIDDWGAADKAFLSYWRYPEPDEATLRRELIVPLQKHHAVVSANVVTGYIDRKSRRIISPWTQNFIDQFGVRQDYTSARRGLLEAVRAGVIEIQSHGWTHMQPDLESPPGPWWTADLKGEASAGGWYVEFEDRRRGKEIPAIVQLSHLQHSLDCLWQDFEQHPLEFRPGGGAWSKSPVNFTPRVAASLGFGLFHAEPTSYYYLDHTLVLDLAGLGPEITASFDRPLNAGQWPSHADGPVMLVFHDRDIALQAGFVDRLLSSLPAGYTTVSANQYAALLHADIDCAGGNAWQMAFDYGSRYCAYFDKHRSYWRLWLSDPLRKQLEALQHIDVYMDGTMTDRWGSSELARETMALEVPPGARHHVCRLEAAK
jgi:hypothetical protein